MKTNLEVLIGKGKADTPGAVVAEHTTAVGSAREGVRIQQGDIEKEVVRYLRNRQERDEKQAKEKVTAVYNKTRIDNRVLRTPEAEFQNMLLRLLYNKQVEIGTLTRWIKSAIAEHVKKNSADTQQQMDAILRGVESCESAASSVAREMETMYVNKETWVATNDQVDARYQVDLLAGVEGDENNIEVLQLVQVKSSTDQDAINHITDAHQEYLDALPHFVGLLNIKEAASQVEREAERDILDVERRTENAENMALFGLVLDEYLNSISGEKEADASAFFARYRHEGGILNPFTVIGILKNPKMLDKYRSESYFSGDVSKEAYLAKTADTIPYTEAESVAFHEKNHVRTIIKSATIVSVVMVGGRKVSEKVLRHPFEKKS